MEGDEEAVSGQEPSTKEKSSEFLDRVKKLAQEDNGYRASLRRSAGALLNVADGKAVVNFYKAYPGEPYYEEQYFLVACVQCLWSVEELGKAVPIEKSARNMDDSSRGTFEKRMEALLDLTWEKDGYLAGKILRLIKFCKSKGAVIDCKALLSDLIKWNYESRVVQKKWVRELYNISYDKKGEN